jgi:hypothetical protein
MHAASFYTPREWTTTKRGLQWSPLPPHRSREMNGGGVWISHHPRCRNAAGGYNPSPSSSSLGKGGVTGRRVGTRRPVVAVSSPVHLPLVLPSCAIPLAVDCR